MTIEEVLQAAYEMVANNDHVALLVLADMLEEAGMEQQAKRLRTRVGKIPSIVGYEILLNGKKFQVEIQLAHLVTSTAIYASQNVTRKCQRLNGDIIATLKDNSNPTSRRQKNTLPLSALQGVDLND